MDFGTWDCQWRTRQPDRPIKAAWGLVLLLSSVSSGLAQTTPPDSRDMPEIGLDWPDLGADAPEAPAAGTPSPSPDPAAPTTGVADSPMAPLYQPDEATREAEQVAELDPTRPFRYSTELDGFDRIRDRLFDTRFDMLSELRKGERESANIAQITRRARTDVELLDTLLRTRGYYDGNVSYRLRAPDEGNRRVSVRLTAEPGPLYRLDEVTISGLTTENPREAKLRSLFSAKSGDPADADAILGAADALRTGLAEGGYPFAKVDQPVLRTDDQARDADLTVEVVSGGFRRFGRFRVSGDPPFNARHVGEIARFAPGEDYRLSALSDLDRAIIQTGLVASVSTRPVASDDPDKVDILVTMSKAPPRTISGALGYGTGEGPRAEVSWQHRNLFPPEGSLTLAGVVGTEEQSASATFRRSNFGARDRALNGQLAVSNVDRAAYDAQSVTLSASLERQSNILFQKAWTWSFGTELILSDIRDLYGVGLTPRRRTYYIAAVPLTLKYDGSDDLLDPTRGFRLAGLLSPELSFESTTFGYVRAQVDASAYYPISDRLTLAGRTKLGTIVGANADRIAPTRRYYAGGGASVRGYSYQAIGPRDLNNDPVGGRSVGEVSLEARYRFGAMRQFGIVPFVDAGTISSTPWPSITDMRVGAGIGFRYYSNFGPIRIDVGTPINPQPGDSRIGVYVSLGQAF